MLYVVIREIDDDTLYRSWPVSENHFHQNVCNADFPDTTRLPARVEASVLSHLLCLFSS